MTTRLDPSAKYAITATLLAVGASITYACSSAPSLEVAAQGPSALQGGSSGGNGRQVLNRPWISTRGKGLLDVFVIQNGVIAQRSYNGAGFGPWADLPPTNLAHWFVGQPVAVSWDSTRIDIFAVDDLGHLEHNWSTSGTWQPFWESLAAWALPASCFSDPPSAADGGPSFPAASGMAVTSWGPNRLDVFLPCALGGTQGQVTQITYDSGWQSPRLIQATANVTLAPGEYPNVGAVSWGSGRIDLAVKGGINGDSGAADVFHYWTVDGVSWSGPDDFAPPTNRVPTCDTTLSSWGPNILTLVQDNNGPFNNRVWLKPLRSSWGPWVSNPLPAIPPQYEGDCIDRPSSTSWGPQRIDLVYPAVRADGGAMIEHAWYNDAKGTWLGPEEL